MKLFKNILRCSYKTSLEGFLKKIFFMIFFFNIIVIVKTCFSYKNLKAKRKNTFRVILIISFRERFFAQLMIFIPLFWLFCFQFIFKNILHIVTLKLNFSLNKGNSYKKFVSFKYANISVSKVSFFSQFKSKSECFGWSLLFFLKQKKQSDQESFAVSHL